jgi:[acyl-carrier-protein] S-malonyltransferase
LYDDFRIMQEYFEEASSCLNINFVKVCFAASDVELSRMETAYPTLFLVSCAIAQILKEQNIHPDAVAGYNSGEYAAIHTARGLTFPDGLYLLSKYSAFYQELVADQDLKSIEIIGCDYETVQAICTSVSSDEMQAFIAAHKDERVCIVGGHRKAVEQVQEEVKKIEDASTASMPLEFGLHSPIIDPIVSNYTLYMEKVDFKDLEVPLYANADARQVTLGGQVKERVIEQVTHTLQWFDIIKELEEYECIVVIGPGTDIQKMVQARYPEKACVAINTKADIKTLKRILNPSVDDQEE